MAAEFVRVRLPNGVEKTLPAATAKRAGFTVLDEPALNARGVMLPTKRPSRAAAPVKAEEPEPLTAMRVSDLKAEIDKRNKGRDEANRIAADGKKADLVAALEADNAASKEK